MTVLGIDLGTQSVKVAAVEATRDGRDPTVVASASRPYPVDSPHPGWAQSDPQAWLAAVSDAAAEVLDRIGDTPVALGLSGQMHGVVLTDDTGAVATDPSDASGTLLYDLVAGAWSEEAMVACRVRSDLLAPVQASGALAGMVRADPHLAGLPVATGGADAACGVHGLGLTVGRGALALGTGAQLSSVIATADPDDTLRTHTFATVGRVGEAFYRLGAVQSGGLALERVLAWLGADVAEAQRALAAGIRPGDPLFFPFVAGERSPYLDPDLRASWLGLSLSTTREAMLRSVLEGMAYTVAAAYAAIVESGAAPASPLTVLGGGSRDPAYVALLATALGISLRPAAVADATVIGAARLGADVVGESFPALAVAAHGADAHGIVEPAHNAIVSERQQRWVADAPSSQRGQSSE